MNEKFYFLEEIEQIKELKNYIKQNRKTYTIDKKIIYSVFYLFKNLLFFIILFIKELFFQLKNFKKVFIKFYVELFNKKKLNSNGIVNITKFYYLLLWIFITYMPIWFLYTYNTYTDSSIINLINKDLLKLPPDKYWYELLHYFNSNETFFIIILWIIAWLLFYPYFKYLIQKITLLKPIEKHYWIGKDKSIFIKEINWNKILLPGNFNLNKILKQLNFIEDLLIELNKIEWSINKTDLIKLNKLIKISLKYQDILNYFELFKFDKIKENKIKTYFKEIKEHVEKVDEEIKKIMDTELYKINFWKDAKKLKKEIETRYNYISKEIKKLRDLLSKTHDEKVQKEISAILNILEKEELELNTIRQSYTDISLLKRKTKIFNKLENELNFLNKEQKNIQHMEKENNLWNILNKILNV